MDHLISYPLFESEVRVKQQKMFRVTDKTDPNFKFVIKTDTNNRIINIINPSGIRHGFKRDNVLNRNKLQKWVIDNDLSYSDETIKNKIKDKKIARYVNKRNKA